MKQLSNCCSADIEQDLSPQGVFSLTSGCLICRKCRKYCGYGRVVPDNSYCDQCTLNSPHTHSAFKVVTESEALNKHDPDNIDNHCGLLDCQLAHKTHDRDNCTRCNPKAEETLTPLGEALQANCPRCNMRWIIHNCPQYPKLLDAKEMIKKLARGAVLQELAENADYFTSIKCDGEEFNVYVKEYKAL